MADAATVGVTAMVIVDLQSQHYDLVVSGNLVLENLLERRQQDAWEYSSPSLKGHSLERTPL